MEGSVMQTVINATGDVISLGGTLLTKIVENPITLFYLAAGLLPIGFGVIRKMKRAAK